MDANVRFLLMVLVSYLGLAAGVVISRMAKEEIKPGKKYFNFLKIAILTAIVSISAFYLTESILASAGLAIFAFVFGYWFEKSRIKINKNLVGYIVFAVLLFFAREDIISAIISGLVFIYGIAVASIAARKLEKLHAIVAAFKVLWRNSIFPILSVILILLIR
ncbi:hypothetical protein JXC34_04040 [Candidatus Woesearchaeota archaeon]|nr:hypothetical protein [Candidatus Woesearchaeota archaeon]